jgi:nitrile hydratase
MDGVHDVGGTDGFGPIDAPSSEPVFAEDWERRAVRVMLATTISLGRGTSAFRHSIERMDPGHYLTSSYYEHWLTGATTMAVEAGTTSQEELDERADGGFPLSRPDRGTPPDPAESDRTEARFALGDAVRVRAWHPQGHTRAPRYVQGRRGVIVRVDGPENVPDFEAHGGRTILDPTYSVRFRAAELWGEGAEAGATVHVDVWERYLEVDG